MIDEKIINEVKSQLWSHLQYLVGRIEELQRTGQTIRSWDWLGDQYKFCKSEVVYWKRVAESVK